ncbi:MAG: ester cyclase [Xanthomonadales bacterium]|nr:ester cyclase [Xanthomonadales bacterium]
MNTTTQWLSVLAVFCASALGLAACTQPAQTAATQPSAQSAAEKELASIKATQAQGQKNLATFDDLDFNRYSNQDWEGFHKSHANDILVHYPDGHTTKGLEAHFAELKPQFVFAPDTKIKSHPIRIADGNYTAVMGIMEGTFSRPMPIGDGKTIPPTNKHFSLPMTTIGRWENGLMEEEWLFWDNQAFMKQVGLAK